MTRLEERGCFTRERQGNGRYLYRIAERFLARWRGHTPAGRLASAKPPRDTSGKPTDRRDRNRTLQPCKTVFHTRARQEVIPLRI